MLNQIHWLVRINRQVDIDIEAWSAQEIRADRHQMGKKIQAEIAQITDYQVDLFEAPTNGILGKPLVAVGTLADGEMFGLFAFDVVAIIYFDARGAGITAAAF